MLAVVALLIAGVAGPSSARAAFYASIDAGADHTCAIRPGGSAYCWGTGQYGQLGVIGASRARTPLGVIGSYTAIQLSSGNGYWCELLAGGKVSCTGNNPNGQLGTGNTSLAQYPQDVIGLPSASRVEVGRATSCAMTTDGVYCWGDGAAGQLGDGNFTVTPTPTPRKITGLGAVVDLSVGNEHVCAVGADHQVYCWGDSTDGKLGNGTQAALAVAGVPVTAFTGVAQVAAGGRHTCAVKQDHTVWCWGNNELGQLGAGPVQGTNTPTQVQGLTDVVQISTQVSSTCAVRADGTVWCWGEGLVGQLGNGGRVSSNVPVQVQGISGATAVTVGTLHACAITKALIPYCWGSNRFAQLGSGGLIGAAGIEPTAEVVQDAVRGTAQFLPTPQAEQGSTSRGGKVYLRLLRLTRRGSKCPTKAAVTIRTRGKEVVRTATDIEKVDGGCAVTGRLDLPTKTQRAFTVVVVVRGDHMKTRKVTLKTRVAQT